MKVRTNVVLDPVLWKFAQDHGKLDDRSGSYILNKLLKDLMAKHTKVKKKAQSLTPKDNEVIAGYVPCTNGTYEVTQSNVDTWVQAYPNVDIPAELNKVVAWLDSNPKKTVSGCKKFLNAWLNRAQNSVKSTGGNKQSNGKTSGNFSACEDFING